MELELPGESEARLDAQTLRRALDYSSQHRNVIGIALKKEFPDRCPEGQLDEEAFYRVLLELLADAITRSQLRTILGELADRKRKTNWQRVLNLPMRLIDQAIDLVSVQVWQVEDGPEALFKHAADAGHPELGWWFRWAKVRLEPDEGLRQDPSSEDPKPGTDALQREWRHVLESVEANVKAATEEPPSIDHVTSLAEQVSQLRQLATAFAEASNTKELIQECTKVLESIDVGDSPDVEMLLSSGCEAIAAYDGSRDGLLGWLDRLKEVATDLAEAVAQEEKYNTALQEAAGRKDYDQIPHFSELAKSARESYQAAVDNLQHLVDEVAMPEPDPDDVQAPEPVSELIADLVAEAKENAADEQVAAPEHEVVSPTRDQNTGEAVVSSADVDREKTPAEADQEGKNSNSARDQIQNKEVSPLLQESAPSADNLAEGKSEPGDEPLNPANQDLGEDGSPAVRTFTLGWDPQVTAQELAEQVLQHEGQQRLASARALAWALIRDGHIPLAYHIAAAAAELDHSGSGSSICSEPLRAIHLGDYLTRGGGEEVMELADTVHRFYEANLTDGQLRGQRALALLSFAALFRPVLMAPYATGAEDLLRGLPLDESLSALHLLREQVLGQKVRFSALTHLDPTSRLEGLREKAEVWYDNNRRHRFKYEPATWVWKHLLESEQPVGRAVSILLHGGENELGDAHDVLAKLQDRSDAGRLIDSADKTVRARKANKKPIEAGPRTDIIRRCGELAGLLSEWVDAFEDQVESARSPGREKILRDVRERLLGSMEHARAQLGELTEAPLLEDRAAAACVSRIVDNVKERLEGGSGIRLPEHSVWWSSLNGVLLPCDSFALSGERWDVKPLRPAEELLEALARLVAPPAWEEVFRTAEERCDHIRTGQLLEWLRLEKRFDEQRLDVLVQRRKRSKRNCSEELRKELDAAQNQVERAAVLGYLGEEERAPLAARLEMINRKEKEDLQGANEEIKRVQLKLEEFRNQQVGEIRQRMEENEALTENPEAHRRIDELLAAGDILTASEYLVLLENGESIPGPAERRDAFKDEFFPAFVDKIQSYLGNRKSFPSDILEKVERGGDTGPLEMRRVPGAQRRSAAEMLKAWLSLKAKRGDVEGHLRKFLLGLGFSKVVVSPERGRGGDAREQAFDVSARPVADRDICMVPRYGSHAKGQYRVICIWERPSEEEVLASAQMHSGGRPVLVLYMGRLSVNRWRNLAVRCRERRQTLLVIDETLAYFLCGERGSRLATFFDCALPFTVAQPYVTTSSDVPPELFFGRRRELEAIFDHTGTNLVYGGRQLGKTALLREVVRRFHRPDEGVIVAWLDLKERLIGLSEPADAVWHILGEELVRQGLFPNARRNPDGTANAITQWLDEEPQRRIVMLLDEADAFLAQDAHDEQFRTVGRLKGLMERTGRRFKVVFAGLHNVQRTSRDVNTPLAHFGKPLCVGPLLSNGEAREAYQLVERPLRQLGYRFESESLINRILAQTNYYPNLIQIFCAHLIEYLQDAGGGCFDPRTTPPYLIKREHVEAVSHNRDLQQTIRSRFQITLDLDTRYQVVALSLALKARKHEAAGDDEINGIETEEIRREALSWWPQGFPDRSYEAFRVLLDEMVGLGVLRRAGAEFKGYALRSPAISGLLGSQSEIEQALLEASEKEPPELYEASTYRRGKRGDPWVRSPLTGQQESEILAEKDGVVVLFGTRLAGLDQVKVFLEEMVAGKDFVALNVAEGLEDKKRFDDRLLQVLEKARDAKAEGLQLLVVPHTEPWTPGWMDLAASRLARRRSLRTQVRVLFVGDARDAWEWVIDGSAGGDKRPEVEAHYLAPWVGSFVTQWSKDAGFGPLGKEDLAEWEENTKWWGGLLAPLGERLKEDPVSWRKAFESFSRCIPATVRDMLASDLPADLVYSLEILARYNDPLSCDDWLELLDNPAPVDGKMNLKQIIRWADLLGLLSPTEGGRWAIDQVVGRALAP